MPAGMEEKNMGKFKVGDRVRVINKDSSLFGKTGVVNMVDSSAIPYNVAINECCRWFKESSLEAFVESEYHPGDKFVIEIESVIPSDGGTLYKIKGFNALVFDDFGIGKLERYEKPGEDVIKLISVKEQLAEANRKLRKADEMIDPFRAEVAKASNDLGLAINQIVNVIAKEDINELPY